MLRITSFERKGNAFLKLDDDVWWVPNVNGELPEYGDSYCSEDSDADDVL
jgi:hypothetical protein